MNDLDLSNNMLIAIQINPVPLLLQRLELTGNHLDDLDESMGLLSELRYAGLSSNKFAVLPVCIKQWSKVSLTASQKELSPRNHFVALHQSLGSRGEL